MENFVSATILIKNYIRNFTSLKTYFFFHFSQENSVLFERYSFKVFSISQSFTMKSIIRTFSKRLTLVNWPFWIFWNYQKLIFCIVELFQNRSSSSKIIIDLASLLFFSTLFQLCFLLLLYLFNLTSLDHLFHIF